MPGYRRLVVSGTLASDTEQWSCGVNFGVVGGGGPSSAEDVQAWAEDFAAVIGTAVTSTFLNGLSSVGKVTGVRTYEYAAIGGDALYTGQAAVNQAGTGTPANPLTTSMVCSLKTGLSGRRYRGRFYWPAISIGISPDGKFGSGNISSAATVARTFLTVARDSWSGADEMYVAVVSAAANAVTPVTSVQVGNVPDTQRRRRDNLVETYVVATITP